MAKTKGKLSRVEGTDTLLREALRMAGELYREEELAGRSGGQKATDDFKAELDGGPKQPTALERAKKINGIARKLISGLRQPTS